MKVHLVFYMVLCFCRTVSVTTQWQGGDVNLYENLRCHGVPLVTISRGRVVYENGIFTCAEGSGKFYPLRTFPDYLYKKMVQREKVLSPLYHVFMTVYRSASTEFVCDPLPSVSSTQGGGTYPVHWRCSGSAKFRKEGPGPFRWRHESTTLHAPRGNERPT